ncbi:MAG: radical SAM protein [Methanomassiliicoccaceae archaeon]|jgi:DNA repair photolyase|nr:radical SAM protein [Methanomassiliicoccaceae archaeon]
MHYADYKTILSPKNGMNIYRGCSHGCIYCDSRSTCYNMDHDFEDIEVKRNAPGILDEQLKRKKKKGMIFTGAMSDPYNHLEEELQMTRQCLSVIEKHGFGVAVLTKSSRILRDTDILMKINKKSRCVVQMTLTTYEDGLCKILEPHVSATSERVNVLMNMKDAGIPTVVWMCPTLPFINDTEENLRGLLALCRDADVKGILCFGFGTTMREGDREYFYKKLDEHFPGMKERYEQAFGDRYVCNSPNGGRLMKIFKAECKKNGIIHETDDVFAFMNEFPAGTVQTSLF